ncbi:MAG TPA: outer membrane beta-barrel protein [Steroidobacteraceae bacterium]|nr:outer membrane beta-barrel protein [Steroidobacteraceae bacterium]
MTRTIRLIAASLAAIGLALPLAAHAAQGFGLYVGAQGGYSEVGISQSDWDAAALAAFSAAGGTLTSTSVDKGATPWGVNAGFQLMRFFAIEAAYYDLGKAKATADGTVLNGDVTVPVHVAGDFQSSGPALAVIGIIPLGHLSIDGRVGAYYGDTKATFTATSNGVSSSTSASKSTATAMGGVGLAWIFNDYFSLRLDYLYFDKVGDKNTTGTANVNVGTLGFRFHFL